MNATIHVGDALTVLRTLPDASVQTCVTSPPYWGLRDYGTATWDGGRADCDHVIGEIRTGKGLASSACSVRGGGHKQGAVDEIKARDLCPHCGARRVDQQIGLEDTPEKFVARLVEVFREVRRVLRDDGVCWINLGDSYAGSWSGNSMRPSGGAQRPGSPGFQDLGSHYAPRSGNVPTGLKAKDLVGIPWRVAFALHADGWWLRSDCIWAKPNPMPESVVDRPTKAHEYVFLLTKSERYFYDAFAVRQAYADSTLPQKGRPYGGVATKDYAQGRAQDPSETKRRVIESMERRGGANLRTVWSIATQPFKGAHFATFPKALADRCILAGTSAHGSCPTCQAPWARIVDSVRTFDGAPTDDPQKRGKNNHWNEAEGGPRPGNWRYGTDRTENGWQPTCDCFGTWRVVASPDGDEVDVWDPPAEPMPPLRRCVVLDPFTGAGTTALSAALLGRDFVGVELNPEFAAMARKRITDEAPLFVQAKEASA